jgi:SAM-dependent methyltransferase
MLRPARAMHAHQGQLQSPHPPVQTHAHRADTAGWLLRYVEEMARVLKPGGTMVIACWCQREETADNPLSEKDKADLKFLYDEWAHPYFISIEEFERLMMVGILG